MTGCRLLNVLEQNKIDLILLDVMMPRLNGLSTLMKLREKAQDTGHHPVGKDGGERQGVGADHGSGRLCGETVQPGGADGAGQGAPAEIPGMGRGRRRRRMQDQDRKRRADPGQEAAS